MREIYSQGHIVRSWQGFQGDVHQNDKNDTHKKNATDLVSAVTAQNHAGFCVYGIRSTHTHTQQMATQWKQPDCWHSLKKKGGTCAVS